MGITLIFSFLRKINYFPELKIECMNGTLNFTEHIHSPTHQSLGLIFGQSFHEQYLLISHKWVIVLKNYLDYGSTVSNKNTHLADFETCVFRGYLRNHLSYEKNVYIYLHPCLKSFQMKKITFL